MYKHGTAQLQQWLGQAQSGVAFGEAAREMLAAEVLAPLSLDGHRRHVQYTHGRTNSVSDVQPDQITREK